MKTAFVILLAFLLAASVNAAPFVIVVRHAEKAIAGGADPELSAAGHERAEALARIVKGSDIRAIFTSEFKRTRQTAEPTAKALGITPQLVAATDTAALVSKLRSNDSNALVVGHGNTLPQLIAALGISEPVNIAEDDYANLFIVTLGDKPQLLRLRYP